MLTSPSSCIVGSTLTGAGAGVAVPLPRRDTGLLDAGGAVAGAPFLDAGLAAMEAGLVEVEGGLAALETGLADLEGGAEPIQSATHITSRNKGSLRGGMMDVFVGDGDNEGGKV